MVAMVASRLERGRTWIFVPSSKYWFLFQENLKTLITYIVEHFMSTLETVEYVRTFQDLKKRHEQEVDRQENEPPQVM